MAIGRTTLISLTSTLVLGICLGLLAANSLPSQAPMHELLSKGGLIVALGSEPGWRLEISGMKEVKAVLDYGDMTLSSEAASRIIPLNSESVLVEYVDTSPVLKVILIRGKCVDAMKGEQHDMAVIISYEGRTYSRCGDFVRD